jgi:alkanesulfonate monooxygenase SsuD/methylene tetrahydromethanopterin reductase-like flavin-dependent oxidoreductase (luciferase family)
MIDAGPAHRRPFRFGVVVAPNSTSTGDWLKRTARAAAGHGYSVLLAPDNLFLMSPMPALATAAASADIGVGTFVMSGPLRAPAVAAWEASSLNLLTDGRFELGIGAGLPVMAPALEAQGIAFGTPTERLARVEETISRAKGLGGPPLHITLAAGGPKTRALAGRLADSVILSAGPYMDMDRLGASVKDFREVAAERVDDIELAMNLLLIGAEPIVPEDVQKFGLDAEKLLEADAASVMRGTVEEMCEELQRRRELLGVSYITVSEPMMEQFAPVVEALSGR